MEITVLLLLTVLTLSVASPLGLTQRSEADTVLSGDSVQASGVTKSEDTREEHVPALKITPFHSEDDRLGLDPLKHNMALRLRPRRTPQRGCQVGTCQVHNLAHTLYNLSKRNDKEKSEKANDPQGYGR